LQVNFPLGLSVVHIVIAIETTIGRQPVR